MDDEAPTSASGPDVEPLEPVQGDPAGPESGHTTLADAYIASSPQLKQHFAGQFAKAIDTYQLFAPKSALAGFAAQRATFIGLAGDYAKFKSQTAGQLFGLTELLRTSGP
ncbi:hypothetical protein AB0H43_20465, partial [Hamadaea sp. NPDC050747]|uniref:hypothetical protein n=1 Tax=Hamadaea sp. NPDC050747 TaxID=3155789 RepID=UPI0033D478A9